MNDVVCDFAVVDLETTGLDRKNDEVVEIAVVLMDGVTHEITDTYETLIKPVGLNSAERFNFITDEMLFYAPSMDEVASTVMGLLAGRKIVGHNFLRFDLAFLSKVFNSYDFLLTSLCCADTLPLVRKFLPGLPNHKLVTVAEFYGLPVVGAHEALADTVMTANMFSNLLKESDDVLADVMRFAPQVAPDSTLPSDGDFRIAVNRRDALRLIHGV